MLKQKLYSAIVAAVCWVNPSSAVAQPRDYPTRPVRIVVPTSPGGKLDVVTRLMALKVSELMGQSLVVDNRPGASTNIGSELVARAVGDGYTLLINSQPLAVNPSLYSRMAFDVEKDLTPVTLLTAAPYVLVVHPSVPVKSVKELLSLARAKPGALNYASGGNGTNFHIAMELFKNQSGVKLTHVPYKGGGAAMMSVLAGEIEVTIPSLAGALPQIKAGRLRALAICSARRSALLPQIPTIAEAGVPGYEFSAWVGVLAPGTTPAALVSTINGYWVKAARTPEVASRMSNDGNDVIAGTPAQFAAIIKAELPRWNKVIRDSGIKPE